MDCRLVNIHTHHPTGAAIEPTFAGIHPRQVESCMTVAEILPAIEAAEMVGEIGLDYLAPTDRELQLRLLHEQLALASRLGKPVILHCVKAFEPVMLELVRHELRAVIFHGFIGSPEQASRALRRGYYLSFGERTFRSPRTIEALRHTPAERIFAETDESTLPIDEIYRRIARAKEMEPEALRCRLWLNYQEIFKR